MCFPAAQIPRAWCSASLWMVLPHTGAHRWPGAYVDHVPVESWCLYLLNQVWRSELFVFKSVVSVGETCLCISAQCHRGQRWAVKLVCERIRDVHSEAAQGIICLVSHQQLQNTTHTCTTLLSLEHHIFYTCAIFIVCVFYTLCSCQAYQQTRLCHCSVFITSRCLRWTKYGFRFSNELLWFWIFPNILSMCLISGLNLRYSNDLNFM